MEPASIARGRNRKRGNSSAVIIEFGDSFPDIIPDCADHFEMIQRHTVELPPDLTGVKDVCLAVLLVV